MAYDLNTIVVPRWERLRVASPSKDLTTAVSKALVSDRAAVAALNILVRSVADLNTLERMASGPMSVSGLALWYAASWGTAFTNTGATAPVTGDQSSAKSWVDMIGGITVTEATNPPTFVANAGSEFTGAGKVENPNKPAMRFDGTNDVLRTDTATTLLNAAAGTTCIVVHVPRSVSVAAQQNFIAIADGATITVRRFAFGENNTNAGSVFTVATPVDGGTVGSLTATGGQVSNNTPAIATARVSFTAEHKSQWWVNGTSVAAETDIGLVDGPYSATNSLRLTVGANVANTPALFMFGDIYEILLYNVALSTANRVIVERYLGNKYGIVTA